MADRLGWGRSTSLGWVGVVAVIFAAGVVALRNLPASPGASPPPTASMIGSPSAGGTRSPSQAPSQNPVPSGPYVEPNVVDRPGVPAALYDKYWAAYGQVGQVGTTAWIVIPLTERVIGRDAGWVASIPVNRDEAEGTVEPIVGPDGVTVIVRDIRTGATLRTFETSIAPEHGLGFGSLLFWTGLTLPLDAPDRSDGGVWVIDLTAATEAPIALVPPGDIRPMYGSHAERGAPRLTDLGRAVATVIIGEAATATQIIDVASRSVRTTVDDHVALEVVDSVALIIAKDGLELLDLESGKQVGPGIETDQPYGLTVAGTQEVFAQFATPSAPNGGSYISAINLRGGDVRPVYAWPGATRTVDLSPELSAPDLLVLLPTADLVFDDRGIVQIPVALLDPATGDLQPDAFVIGNP